MINYIGYVPTHNPFSSQGEVSQFVAGLYHFRCECWWGREEAERKLNDDRSCNSSLVQLHTVVTTQMIGLYVAASDICRTMTHHTIKHLKRSEK